MAVRVGFIGLGVMGGHMARHLSDKYATTVYDVDAGKVAKQKGGEKARSIQQVGENADLILLSLPSSEIVREVICGTEGLIHVLEKGNAVIDTSTTEPTVSRAMAQALIEKGIDFLDAPVSGGEGGARDAALAIMAGGDPAVFERYSPVLQVMAKSVVRVGAVGTGGAAKLVNNMIVGAAFSVIAEGFALAMKNGIDPAILYEAIKDGWAGSKVLDVAASGIIKQDYEPGGTIDLLFKDIGYALSLARVQNVPVPITAMVDEILKTARASGRGPYAQQIITQMWENLLEINRGEAG
jgi:2-hydroxy-3-oxopropionate reductase